MLNQIILELEMVISQVLWETYVEENYYKTESCENHKKYMSEWSNLHLFLAGMVMRVLGDGPTVKLALGKLIPQ